MVQDQKIIEYFNTTISLYEGRTPIPQLERALTSLPVSFLEVVASQEVKPLLHMFGDNCYGMYIIPDPICHLAAINIPNGVDHRVFETPDGKHLAMNYQGFTYTVKLSPDNIDVVIR